LTPQPQKQMTYNYEAPLNHWTQQVNFYENSIIECEEACEPIPAEYRSKLNLAKAAKKCWVKAAKEEMAAAKGAN